jgi:hypothetical protein
MPAAESAPEPVATTAMVEGEPDSESRNRGRVVRLALGAIVALVALVVLVVVIIDGSRNGVGDSRGSRSPALDTNTTMNTAPAGSGAPIVFGPVLLPSGMTVTRTWRLAGANGGTFIASIDVNNPTGQTKSDNVTEVIPKAIAADVSQVKFFGGTPKVVSADPVVSFDVTVAPGKATRIGYQVSVPADGNDTSRLLAWKAQRDMQQTAIDVGNNTPLPGSDKPTHPPGNNGGRHHRKPGTTGPTPART